MTLERIQIEGTVHFGPELLSREILESQFGVLFRPNDKKQPVSDQMISLDDVALDCCGSCSPLSQCHLCRFSWGFFHF